jgi:hypothetical protein
MLQDSTMGKDKQKMDVEIRHCSVGDQWPQCSQNNRINDTPYIPNYMAFWLF